jgi:hypothetical protein
MPDSTDETSGRTREEAFRDEPAERRSTAPENNSGAQ